MRRKLKIKMPTGHRKGPTCPGENKPVAERLTHSLLKELGIMPKKMQKKPDHYSDDLLK